MNTPIYNFKPEGELQADIDANNFSIWDVSQISVWTLTVENLAITSTTTFPDQAAGTVLGGPQTGPDDTPTWRTLVNSDLPTIDLDKLTISGTAPSVNNILGYTDAFGEPFWTTTDFVFPDLTDIPEYYALGIESGIKWLPGLPRPTSARQIGYSYDVSGDKRWDVSDPAPDGAEYLFGMSAGPTPDWFPITYFMPKPETATGGEVLIFDGTNWVPSETGSEGDVLTLIAGIPSWEPPVTGGGTVTSVAVTPPTAGFTISGGPITDDGTLVFTLADDLNALEDLTGTGIARRTALNTWTVGTAVGLTTEVTGVLPVANGGTGLNGSSTGGTGQVVKQVTSGGAFTVGTLPFSDLSSKPTTLSGYGITDAQPLDTDLTQIANLTSAADKVPYATGAGTWSLADFTSAGRALVDDADASAQRTTLGLVIGTNVQAYDAELAALASVTSAANKIFYFTNSGTGDVADFTATARAITAVASIAKGDIIVGTGTNTVTKLAVGTNGYSIVADSAESSGIKWQQGPAVDPTVCGLRMSMNSTDPYGTGSGTTLYVHPTSSSYIPLYSGSAWALRDIGASPLSFSLTLTSGSVYDVFLYDNSGTIALDFVVWTNTTTRATGLAAQNGVSVKSGSTGRRYIGTVLASATNTITVNGSDCGIDNEHNRVHHDLFCTDSSTSWTYNSTTYREANSGSTIGTSRVRCVVGKVRDACNISQSGTAYANTTGYFALGIGLNSTTTNSGTGFGGYVQSGNPSIHTTCRYTGKLPLGVTVISRLEACNVTITFEGQTTLRRGGLIATITQ